MAEPAAPQISVWAPSAHRVGIDVSVHGRTTSHAMRPSTNGWWSWTAYQAPEGPLDYAFRVDDGDPTPDPRSAWQPHGVHGPSRWFDAGRHAWRDAGWPGPQGGSGVLGAALYELHVGTFTPEGSLDAAIGRLDHLVALGVDVVELMPVAAFPGRWGWGYDGVQPYAVHDQYGGPAALQRFVDACHLRGLGVCLDVVYNHLGPSGNYLARFGPYFTERHATPWGTAVNLDDEGNEGVRAWIIDNALRWFRDFHLDALRLDAVHELKDDSPRHIVAQLSDETASLGAELARPLGLIAESDLNDALMVTPTREGGRGMTAQWDDDVHHALHCALTGERQGYYGDFGELSVLAHVLTDVFWHDGRWSSFRGQQWGAPVDPSRHDGRRFVAYLQTHDQVGNRAAGDRITATLTRGQQAIGAALYLCSAFTPMVFMGEEWAASTPFQFFTDFDEEWLAEAVRDGRRSEFAGHGWPGDEVPDPQDDATRERSVLRWPELEQVSHSAMLSWYQALLALRRKEPELSDGRLGQVRVTFDESARWLVLSRGSLSVVTNFARHLRSVPLDGADDVVLAWEGTTTELEAPGIRLGGHGVAVVRTAGEHIRTA